MDDTYTQMEKKKNRAAIPEFHYFTIINTWLQLVLQSVSSEEKEEHQQQLPQKPLRNKHTVRCMQDKGYFPQNVLILPW